MKNSFKKAVIVLLAMATLFATSCSSSKDEVSDSGTKRERVHDNYVSGELLGLNYNYPDDWTISEYDNIVSFDVNVVDTVVNGTVVPEMKIGNIAIAYIEGIEGATDSKDLDKIEDVFVEYTGLTDMEVIDFNGEKVLYAKQDEDVFNNGQMCLLEGYGIIKNGVTYIMLTTISYEFIDMYDSNIGVFLDEITFE